MRRLFFLLAALASPLPTWAQPVPGPSAYAPVPVPTACGSLNGLACQRILPVLAAQTIHAGLVLTPAADIAPLAAMCEGLAALAIVPRDAAAASACPNRFDAVGQPLYPVYAFLAVLADAPIRHLDDFREEGPNEQPRVIVSIGAASVVFEAVRATDPAWRHLVALNAASLDEAFRRLGAGTADGVFVVEPLAADIVGRVRSKLDDKGRPSYRFINIFPGKSMFRTGDGRGHCLYRPAGLDFGGGVTVTTISMDTIAILARGFRDVHARGGPAAGDAVAIAIDRTRDTMLSAAQTQRDWRPAAGSCQ